MPHIVSIYREDPEGVETEIRVESDGRNVTGAWDPTTLDARELTPDEHEAACVAATEAAEVQADADAAMAEDAHEARRE